MHAIQPSCILLARKAVPWSWVMKEHDVRQRIESFLKRTAREVVIPASVGLGLALTITLAACSQGGTGGFVPIQGGHAGSTTTSQGGTVCSPPPCASYPMCNPSDQQVATAGPNCTFPSWDCPAERECYTLQGGCGPILCLLPAGLHCSDSLSCNPGDTPTTSDNCVGSPSPCYENRLCTRSIYCRNSASPYGGICTGTWSDGGTLEPPDASAGSDDAGTRPCCGDGVPDYQYGEQCDLGPLNGVPLNTNKSSPSFWNPDPNGIVLCDSNCTNPNPLCDLDWKGGIICD
jgi:hypothetical protein